MLFEGQSKNGFMFGFTPNYVKVKAVWNPKWVNQNIMIELQKTDGDGIMLGTVKEKIVTT